MNKEIPQLRDKQIEQLAFYIANPKCLDLSDPGTGKTPPICVYSFWHWAKNGKKTFWTMPKSLLKKNKKEMLRFTEFEDDDIVILNNDRADLTKNWTGPTIESTRSRRGFKVRLAGSETITDTIELRDLAGFPVKFMWRKIRQVQYGPPEAEWIQLGKKGTSPGYGPLPDPQTMVEVIPLLDPKGEPQKMVRHEPEVFKDLIKAASGAKVFIATFAFGANHYERLLEANPDIDLFVIDEIHMPGGYSTAATKATDSFFWINRHCSRMVAMTGTLINGRLDSAWPAIHAIEPRYYGSHDGFIFEHAALIDDYGRVLKWKGEEKITQILARHGIRRTFEEVYGQEPVVFFVEHIQMEEKAQEAYDQFEAQAMLELSDGSIIDGNSPGVAQMRARQILAHPETMISGVSEWTPRDDRIAVHLAEGKKTLIFSALKPEQERLVALCKSLGLRVALINSDVSGPARARIDEQAQRGELDVIVGSGPTVAVGYNWEMFDLVIFASIDYMDTNILQAYRRASRGSRTSILRVIFLRYRADVEDRVYQIVTEKSALAHKVDPTRTVLTFENSDI